MSSQLVLCVGDYVEVHPENPTGRQDSEGSKAYITDIAPVMNDMSSAVLSHLMWVKRGLI